MQGPSIPRRIAIAGSGGSLARGSAVFRIPGEQIRALSRLTQLAGRFTGSIAGARWRSVCSLRAEVRHRGYSPSPLQRFAAPHGAQTRVPGAARTDRRLRRPSGVWRARPRDGPPIRAVPPFTALPGVWRGNHGMVPRSKPIGWSTDPDRVHRPDAGRARTTRRSERRGRCPATGSARCRVNER